MEEAPIPETKIEPEGEVEHMKKFEALYTENVKYEISIYKKGIYLIIETEINKNSQNIKYSNYYDLDSLKRINKFLALCESIDDIIDTICENATNYKCNIIENHNDYEIKIPVPVKNLKEISFILKERKKTQNEIINDLKSKTILLNNKIEVQNQKIEEQNRKIDQLETKIKNLEVQNNKIKIELKEIIKKEIIEEIKKEKEIQIQQNKINPIVNSKSKIINDELFKQLNNWINPSKSLKFELIFIASINGDKASDFHKYCDGKGPTVTIVKGKNGHIFGGYVTVPFSSDHQSHFDDKAFLFSLTNKKQFPIKIKEQAVCHYLHWGPYIGYKEKCDLAINTCCLNNNKSYSEPNSYEFTRVELIGTTERKFEVADYEVYLVN